MEFSSLIAQRYSVRRFDPKPVPHDKISAILQAARLSPTATNAQPQRILVVERPDLLEKVYTCTRYHFEAPLMFVVCYDSNASWKRPSDCFDCGVVDATIVATHLALAITNEGLGSTWVGNFDP